MSRCPTAVPSSSAKANFIAAAKESEKNTGKRLQIMSSHERRFLLREINGVKELAARLESAAESIFELLAAIPRQNPNYYLILDGQKS